MMRSESVIPIPPGYTISERMEDMNISEEEFARQMNMTSSDVTALLNGDCILTESIAKQLESVLITESSIWNRLEEIYREKIQKAIDENNGKYSMYSAFDIACWLIAKNNAEQRGIEPDNFEGISNMKLQKMLYFAQGIGCALFKRKIFKEDLLAWQHGPVVREAYSKFSQFGNQFIILNEIPDYDPEDVEIIEFCDDAVYVLNLVYDEFNKYTASQLRKMSHEEGSPWAKAYIPNKYNSVIPLDDEFLRYFREKYGYLKK